MGDHAQRDLRAVAGFHVKVVERGGIGLEVLPDLHHHVILVELGEHRRDLALTEGIVERVVNVGHGDAQPRSGVAVDNQLGAQALVLQVAGHIGHRIFLAELLNHQARIYSPARLGPDLQANTETPSG